MTASGFRSTRVGLGWLEPFHTSIGDFILGEPLASSELKKQALAPWTGMPLLGLDSLASTGYGPEAALAVLLAADVAALRYFQLIVILLVAQLSLLYFPTGRRQL